MGALYKEPGTELLLNEMIIIIVNISEILGGSQLQYFLC